jgi:hypothetical protein
MERHLREMWTPFTGGEKGVFDMVPEFFVGNITHLAFYYKICINHTQFRGATSSCLGTRPESRPSFGQQVLLGGDLIS